MEPVAALARIAYLLDRVREKPYRVRAYLRAAEVVKTLPADELRARVAAGTLQELDGIGPKTAALITEVATTGSTASPSLRATSTCTRCGAMVAPRST